MNIVHFILVGIGGALGSILRFGLSIVLPQSKMPVSTLAVNFLGSLIIGAALSNIGKEHLSHYLAVVGFCGGFTTFSTFSADVFEQLKNGNPTHALIYAIVSIVICVGAVYIGSLVRIKN